MLKFNGPNSISKDALIIRWGLSMTYILITQSNSFQNVGLMISNIPPQTQSDGSLSLECSRTGLRLERRYTGPMA